MYTSTITCAPHTPFLRSSLRTKGIEAIYKYQTRLLRLFEAALPAGAPRPSTWAELVAWMQAHSEAFQAALQGRKPGYRRAFALFEAFVAEKERAHCPDGPGPSGSGGEEGGSHAQVGDNGDSDVC